MHVVINLPVSLSTWSMYLILLFDYFELKNGILNQMLIAVVLTFGTQSNDYIESYLICIDHDIFIHCYKSAYISDEW